MENNPIEGAKRPLPNLSKWPVRFFVVLGTIVAGMFITIFLSSRPALGLFSIWPTAALMFPVGFYSLVNRSRIENEFPIIFFGWLLYAAITFLATRAKNRKTFFIIYGVLIVVLALNIKGCTQMLSYP